MLTVAVCSNFLPNFSSSPLKALAIFGGASISAAIPQSLALLATANNVFTTFILPCDYSVNMTDVIANAYNTILRINAQDD